MAQFAEKDSPPPPPTMGRRPAQKRGQARVAALLDAADALLQERDINDISLYDVAHAADVPPTSAYHFFPTKESIFLGLADRYLQTMHAALDAPFDYEALEHWQDLVALRYNRVVDYFNASQNALKLFMGMALMSDVRRLDFQDMDNLAARTYQSMNRYFEMPYVREPAFKFSISFAIYDGVWATSYAKHGHITPKYAKEGLRAALAYMSTFLPSTIAPRSPESLAQELAPKAEAATPLAARPAPRSRRAVR
ncbi:TetR/AcrR family transcriptional regulator [Caulobacter sp. KR2-114]|uniref:TetR/AcrR family transcriptional regulator n=1 Tax=Caulobacter sp. KR2-114 TaxID=3400912 RepID=UPI003C06C8D2